MKKPFGKFIKAELKKGFLLIACGLPGTGKTTLTEAVQKIKGGRLLKSDIIRRELLKDQDIFDVKIAGDMKKRIQVYEEMFRQADAALDNEKNVILDATFLTQALRQQAAAIAARHGVAFVILQSDCPDDICLARIQARDKATSVSNALTGEAYLSNKKDFEPVDIDNLKKLNPNLKLIYIVVDTSKDPPDDWYITRYEKR